jgi:hypothetical protein
MSETENISTQSKPTVETETKPEIIPEIKADFNEFKMMMDSNQSGLISYHNLYKLLCLITLLFTGFTNFFYLVVLYTVYSFWEQLNNWTMLIHGIITGLVWLTLEWSHISMFITCVSIYENRSSIIDKLKQYKALFTTHVNTKIEEKHWFYTSCQKVHSFCQVAYNATGQLFTQIKSVFSPKKMDKLNTFIGDKTHAVLTASSNPRVKFVTDYINAVNFHVNKVFMLGPLLVNTCLEYLNASEKLTVLDKAQPSNTPQSIPDDLMSLFKEDRKAPVMARTMPAKKFSTKDIEKIILSKQQKKKRNKMTPLKLPDMAELEKMEQMLKNPVLSSIMEQMAKDNTMLKQMDKMFG